MKWVYITLAIIGTLILLIVVIGALLPVKHRVSINKKLPGSQEQVWDAISNFGNYQSWRTNLKSVETLSDDSWTEVDERNDKITFQIQLSEEPHKLVSQIMDKNLPFGGQWTFELESTESNSTSLTITEDGEIYNIVFRFFAKFIFGYDSTIKGYFEHLENHLNEK